MPVTIRQVIFDFRRSHKPTQPVADYQIENKETRQAVRIKLLPARYLTIFSEC
jgi:hypothetical protein